MKFPVLCVLAVLLLLAACAPTPTGKAVSTRAVMSSNDSLDDPLANPVVMPVKNASGVLSNETTNTTANGTESKRYTKYGMEGELIELSPQVFDPDGNRITYSFMPPFDERGRWMTRIGDEGRYTTIVMASDGNDTINETVNIVVQRANRPPVVSCSNLAVQEGVLIDLGAACNVTDEDSTELVVTYSGWMQSDRYQTTFQDAGDYTVVVTATDKRQGVSLHTVKQQINISVLDSNRAPVFAPNYPTQILLNESEIVTMPSGMVTDPDGDAITVSFSAPIDKAGKWVTTLGDAGEHKIVVTATDGKSTTTRDIMVIVGLRNTAPVLAPIADILAKEGDLIKLPINATDREGDNISIRIEGWMTTQSYKTTFDDAGSHVVRITVSDGVMNSTQDVRINVQDVNRAPVFIIPA